MAADPGQPASLKHALRTPLNHILGFTELLLEEVGGSGTATLEQDLQRIHTAGRRLLTVINDLFAASKDGRGTLDEAALHHELRTPLNQILGYAEMLQEEAAEQGRSGLVPDLEKIHAAAQRMLELVVEELIPAQRRGPAARGESDAGATTFWRREPTAGVGAPGSAGLVGAILVVDDDEANRAMLGRRLERLGHRVTLVENGWQALERAREEPFDLMLLDIQMPGLDGYQVLERLKADPALRDLPVIILSASDDVDRVAHAVQMGAEDYLPKPFDPVLLQARLGACLEKKRLRDREVSHLRQIEEEKKRSDELLHVILPANVAAELKARQVVQPRRYDPVGVLFCDIAGFTAYCDRHAPEEVLRYLQGLVEAFELLSLQHGLEKIKTIGDSYMAVAGLLEASANPALACVKCGLAMIAAARVLPPHWQVRVGVHVGPVVAGVVGQRKYQYDVWGDTVNTAARMEEAALPGTVGVTAGTWRLLEGFCRGRSRGRSLIPGKGEQELYVVEELL